MKSLFQRDRWKPHSDLESVAVPFPTMRGAEIAAVFSGQRRGGDFYELLRVSPSRVLFGLVELHSRLKQSRKIPSTLRRIFCDAGTQLLKSAEANECDALIELFTQLNRFVIEEASEHTPARLLGTVMTRIWARSVTSTLAIRRALCAIPLVCLNFRVPAFLSAFSHTLPRMRA